jgi:hypothetical protein
MAARRPSNKDIPSGELVVDNKDLPSGEPVVDNKTSVCFHLRISKGLLNKV